MQSESSHDSRRRERVAAGLYRSRTLKATTEADAKKEARKVLARRDDGERVAVVKLTLSAFAESDYFPTQLALVAAGRRSERGVDYYRERFDRNIEPVLGARR